MATCNSASSFGTVPAVACRRRAKWQLLGRLVLAHDVIALQEARGSSEDLRAHAASHARWGTLYRFVVSSGGPSAGGCVLGVSRRIVSLLAAKRGCLQILDVCTGSVRATVGQVPSICQYRPHVGHLHNRSGDQICMLSSERSELGSRRDASPEAVAGVLPSLRSGQRKGVV